MKTIQERALETNPYRGTSPYGEYESGLCVGWDNGYIQGAKEQKAIDDKVLEERKAKWIKKACKWWNMEMREVNYGTYDGAIEAFRKEMEEWT